MRSWWRPGHSQPEAEAAGATTSEAVRAEATAVAARRAFFMPSRLRAPGEPDVNGTWLEPAAAKASGKTCH
ncbi:hypothetical protein GCM10010302_47640 [Streptomyces polychromogenes]|uniref:Uncharacterized protein n=1 Tax=Streptomyces polychromogenes TaxID=67342 RepID=A0ABP3F9A1_9ACTN